MHYCSREHQAEDWKQHKASCKAIAAIMQLRDEEEDDQPHTTELFNAHSKWLKRQFELALERPVNATEYSIILFRPHCGICYRNFKVFKR